MKKYGWPLVTIIVGAFLIKLIKDYVFVSFSKGLLTVLTSLLLFIFGSVLNQHHHAAGADWIKKFLVAALYVFLVIMQLGIFSWPALTMVFDTIGVTYVIHCLLYVYLGYIFF